MAKCNSSNASNVQGKLIKPNTVSTKAMYHEKQESVKHTKPIYVFYIQMWYSYTHISTFTYNTAITVQYHIYFIVSRGL